MQEAGTNYKSTLDTEWKLVDRPLASYYDRDLPALDGMEFRLDGLISFGPCRYGL